MNPETQTDASAFAEIAALYERYRGGAITRDDLLDRLATHLGGAAAASILPILESRRAQTAEQAWAMTIAELSDRQEIQRNVWDFSNAIDLQVWDMLDEVLTLDAQISYDGVALVGPEIKSWLRQTLTRPDLRGYCHMMLDPRIAITGDSAESLTRCLNPMEGLLPDERRQVRYHFVWYHFQHVRTASGWRIRQRLVGSGEPRDIHWQTAPFHAARATAPLPYQES